MGVSKIQTKMVGIRWWGEEVERAENPNPVLNSSDEWGQIWEALNTQIEHIALVPSEYGQRRRPYDM